MVRDKSIILGLVGFPLKHSLSPVLHKFLLNELALVGTFYKFEIREHQLKDAFRDFRKLGLLGFSVTIPHKEKIMHYLDQVSEVATEIGSVNAVTFRSGRWLGDNTDVLGFELTLQQNGVTLKDSVATVLGSGGAARSVVYALIRAGSKKIFLFNRTLTRAQKLAENLRIATGYAAFKIAEPKADLTKKCVAESDFLINATSVGMWPQTEATLFEFETSASGLTAVDLVYNPLETRFLQKARAAGAATVDGLDMLIFQGVESLKLWLQRKNISFDHQKLRRRLIEELKSWQNSDT